MKTIDNKELVTAMEELEKEIKRYEISPTFADKQNGFVSIELISYHPHYRALHQSL